MSEPRPPYFVAVCEGNDCVQLANVVEGAPLAAVVAQLGRLAALMRERGAIGHLVLLDQRTGRVVATRRVWP